MSGIPRRRLYGYPRTNAIYLRHGTSADARAGIPTDVHARNIRGCPSAEYLRMIHGCSAEVMRTSVDGPSRKLRGCPRTDTHGCSAPELKCVIVRGTSGTEHPRASVHGPYADLRARSIHGRSTDVPRKSYGHPWMFRRGSPADVRARTSADIPRRS